MAQKKRPRPHPALPAVQEPLAKQLRAAIKEINALLAQLDPATTRPASPKRPAGPRRAKKRAAGRA